MKNFKFLLALVALGFSFNACADDTGEDKCADVKCASGQTCNPDTGKCSTTTPDADKGDSGTDTDKGNSGTDKEGAACNPKTFTEKCNDNTVVYCLANDNSTTEGVVTFLKCEGSRTCDYISSENFANCFAETCTVGEKGTWCYDDSSYGGSYTGPSECLKFDSGNGRWVDTSTSDDDLTDCTSLQVCDLEGKACMTVYEETTTSCDYASTEDKCEKGKLVTCDYNDDDQEVLFNVDCAKLDATCATAGTGVASCVPSTSTCEAGEKENVCEDAGFFAYQAVVECVKFSNNTYHAVSTVSGYCVNACNEAGTACDSQGVKSEE